MTVKAPPRALAALIATMALTVAIDLASKAWAREALRRESRPRPVIGTVLQVEYRENHGVVFGLLSDGGRNPKQRMVLLALGAVGVVTLAGLLARVVRHTGAAHLTAWAMGLGLAGAVGNLTDRALRGYVVDFIVLGYRGARWPTFNVADVAISVALGLGLVWIVRRR